MTTTLPPWVYRLITHLVEAHDVEALQLVPSADQIKAKTVRGSAGKRAKR
jgi:hypothetical protein